MTGYYESGRRREREIKQVLLVIHHVFRPPRNTTKMSPDAKK